MKLEADSPLIAAGIKITNLLILNLCWLIGCLPLVTIGTSTIAAFAVTLKMAEDREDISITKQFWSAYKAELKHGIPLTLLVGASGYAVWMNFQLFNKLDQNPLAFLLMAIFIIVLLLVHVLYVFALEARYENHLLAALANSRKIFVRFFLRSLGLCGMLLLQWFLFTGTAPVLSYAGIFCLPVLMIYTVSQVSMPIFRRLESDCCANDGLTITGGN